MSRRPVTGGHDLLRGAWALLTFVVACGALGGCALFRKDAGEKEEPPPPPAVRLEVIAPRELETLLETYLDLARLRVLAPGEPIGETELTRLIAAAPAQARELLETEGYFNAQIVIERPPDQPDLVRMRVHPGPRARIEDVRIVVRGPLADATARLEPDAQTAQRALRHGWGLPPGAFFRNRDWSSTKNNALAQLRAEGYVGATWTETSAQVDADNHTVQLSVTADSGPLFRTGELVIEGLQRQDARVVRNLAGFGPGTPATEKLLLDYQERLQTTGLYERVTVLLDPEAPNPESARVTVRLSEQKLQQATVGLGISANIGARVSLEHVHRRAFGQNATARNKIEIAQLRQAWEGELSGHPGRRFYRNLIGGAFERVESDTDTVTSARARIGRAQDTTRIERLYFLQVERAIVRSEAVRDRADAVSINYHWVWRDLDSVVLPTEGYSLSLQGGTGHAQASDASSGPFARGYGRLTGYWPVGRWFSQARVELGQVFVRDGVRVPDTLRFRAGGDDSVRGYGYRELGPIVNGVVTSGNMLFTASAEIARPILERLPDVWGAVFVDAGNAANRWGDLKPVFGFGVGVRWRSPVGPLRVDLAWGEEVQKLRLHFSIGVVF